MMTNKEIRAEARQILKAGWFWRITSVGLALYSIMGLVTVLLLGAFASMNVQTWTEFVQSKIQAMQGGLDYAVPSASLGWSMTGATIFQQLAGWLFGAILLFGIATVMLKAVRNDSNRWLADSFGGFARPLEVLWLIVLVNLRLFLWSLLFIIPGLVALYRYRQTWYVKSEHPDWTASACIRESGCLMKGYKWRAMMLDGFFVGYGVLAYLVAMGCMTVGALLVKALGPAIGGFLSSLLGLGVVWFAIYVIVYALMARAVFYREVKGECPAES